MSRRHAPEVVPSDIEGGGGGFPGKTVSMAGPGGGRPLIQPFEMADTTGKSGKRRSGSSPDKEFIQKVCMAAGGLWLAGWLLMGWELLWPLYLVFDMFGGFLSFPPFSWFSGWFNHGAPLVNQGQPQEELALPQAQVAQYVDHYIQQYGDAALIFATHDGYPQLVKGLLFQEDLGFRELVDARDDSGNTALIYAASKGFRQCTAALLRAQADPELANDQSLRTPLMEAAGGGFKEIVQALRLVPNATMDTQDKHGNTALHYAAYHGHLPVVIELLKANPSKDIQNIYGHTAASYALSNKHKGVADMLNRPETRSQRLAKHKEKQEDDDQKAFQEQLKEQLKKFQQNAEKEKASKHVKGKAEDLHDEDQDDFEPSTERAHDKVSDAERKALEDQIAKLRRNHEESELKSQKKIVELLEKSSDQQQALDRAQEKHREYQMNHTELEMKVNELESKHRSTLLRAEDEADRAKALEDKHKLSQMELDDHKKRVEAAERERDHHAEMAKKHQESASSAQQQVSDHLQKLEDGHKEMSSLREKIQQLDAEKQQEEQRVKALQDELKRLRGGESTGAEPPPSTEPATPEPSTEPPAEEPAKEEPAKEAPSENAA